MENVRWKLLDNGHSWKVTGVFKLRNIRNLFMHNVVKWPNILLKSCAVHTERFLKYVWPFYNIIHERVKQRHFLLWFFFYEHFNRQIRHRVPLFFCFFVDEYKVYQSLSLLDGFYWMIFIAWFLKHFPAGITSSKSIMETPEQYVKSVQS